MTLKTIFSNFDFLGFQIGLEFEMSTKFKSIHGAVLSIIVFIMTTIIGFLFGSEIYQREKPYVTSSATYVENSNVYLKDFPLALYFYNDTELLINPFDYYDVLLYKINFTNSESEFAGFLHGSKPVICRKDHFYPWNNRISEQKINEIMIASPICFDNEEDVYFENTDDDVNSTYIQLTVKSCKDSRKKCPDDYYIVVSQTYVQLIFMESYVNSKDYSNPIKFYIKGNTQQLIPNRIKKSTVVIINNIYYSDDGWILEDKYLTRFTQNSLINNEAIDQIGDYHNHLLWLIFASPKLGIQYDRNYLKVQDLFAKLGGILNVLIVMGKILLYNYTNFKYIVNLNNYFLKREIKAVKSQISIKNVKFISNISKLQNPIVNDKSQSIEPKLKTSFLQNSDIMKINKKSVISSKELKSDNKPNSKTNIIWDKISKAYSQQTITK